MTTIALIGLGEEALLLANTLGTTESQLIGFDVNVPARCPVEIAPSLADAVAEADVVLSLNTPMSALRVAEQAAPHLKSGALFVDANPLTPSVKKKLYGFFPGSSFVDLAIMGSLTQEGMNVTISVSGPGAATFMELLGSTASHLDYVSDIAGDAAARNLLRSFFSKAATAAVIDTLWAAETLGQEEWAWSEIQKTFTSLDAEAVQHLISETAKNFKRNQVELMDVVELFTESGYESTLAAPIQFNYGRIMHNKKIPFAEEPPTEGTWTQPPTL